MVKECIFRLSVPTGRGSKEYIEKISLPSPLSVYKAVDFFRENRFPGCCLKATKTPANRIPLRELINLHNAGGIRPSAIKSMVKDIKKGKEIFHENGLPNTKIIKTELNELLLFDGHHSVLSYMKCGRKFLEEIPFLLLENPENNDGFPDQEFLVFFSKHALKLKGKNWRHYTLNWQAPKNKQLCNRKQKNLGELFDALNSWL